MCSSALCVRNFLRSNRSVGVSPIGPSTTSAWSRAEHRTTRLFLDVISSRSQPACPQRSPHPSVTTLYGVRHRWKNTLVVALSQSGESTDTSLYVQAAREAGALTVGITNEGTSSLTRMVDEVFLVHAGHEKSVAATKTYTGQLLMLYLLAYALGAPIPPKSLERLPALASRALRTRKGVAALSERYRLMNHAIVVGRGLNYANAFELSLKMMETCYVVAERFSGADFLHGPIALVERAFPVFVFSPPGPDQRHDPRYTAAPGRA